jgi:hypothetical protein
MTNAELYMNLTEYLDQVKQFYDDASYPDRLLKLEQMQQAFAEAKSIKLCNPLEYSRKIIAMRRLLLNLLPIWGYPERDDLNQLLNRMLDGCRESLQLPVLKTSN